ncbi:hypothetical protein RZN22_04170 [Bacillaceae bacterium S4-13-58]
MFILIGFTIFLYVTLTVYILAKIKSEWAIHVIQLLKGNRPLNSKEIRKHYEEVVMSK